MPDSAQRAGSLPRRGRTLIVTGRTTSNDHRNNAHKGRRDTWTLRLFEDRGLALGGGLGSKLNVWQATQPEGRRDRNDVMGIGHQARKGDVVLLYFG